MIAASVGLLVGLVLVGFSQGQLLGCPDKTWILTTGGYERSCRNSEAVFRREGGCYCMDGYWYDDIKHICVPRKLCSAEHAMPKIPEPQRMWRCPENQFIFLQVGYERICGSDVAKRIDETGCYCRDGYSYSEQAQRCVPTNQCATAPCAENKEYLCGCPRTCANLNPTCGREDCILGCHCVTGFVFEVGSNKCIPEASCLVVAT